MKPKLLQTTARYVRITLMMLIGLFLLRKYGLKMHTSKKTTMYKVFRKSLHCVSSIENIFDKFASIDRVY